MSDRNKCASILQYTVLVVFFCQKRRLVLCGRLLLFNGLFGGSCTQVGKATLADCLGWSFCLSLTGRGGPISWRHTVCMTRPWEVVTASPTRLRTLAGRSTVLPTDLPAFQARAIHAQCVTPRKGTASTCPGVAKTLPGQSASAALPTCL